MEDSLTQAEELKYHHRADKETKNELVDSLRELKKASEEVEVLLEQKRVQEREV